MRMSMARETWRCFVEFFRKLDFRSVSSFQELLFPNFGKVLVVTPQLVFPRNVVRRVMR